MKIIYRISDGGYNKIKPEYVTKKGCFLHFMKIFSSMIDNIYVVADNVSDDTYNFLCKYLNPERIIRTQLNNAQSFLFSVNFAINNFHYDEEKVYFAEDDYLYTQEAPYVLEEGLDISDYCSGYDHPDKYINSDEGGANPFIQCGGECTRVVISRNRHWKITNSFCMTFGTKIKFLKKDLDIFLKYCSGYHPHDFHICLDLKNLNGRRLLSSIPAVSTHGETQWLSPFIDWKKQFESNILSEI